MTENARPQEASPALQQAAQLVELGMRACEAYGRSDLGERLAATRRTLDDPGIYVVVVGDFKQGKSSLVNALLGTNVCPVDDDVATGLPTYVRYGQQPGAELLYDADPPEREPIELERLREHVVERTEQDAGGRRPSGVVVKLPRTMLASGLVVVDTPGIGGLSSTYAAASLAAVSMADAVLFVTDAAQELTQVEVDYLRRVQEMCDTTICVVTKTDFYPAWRKIVELNQRHLEQLPGTDMLPVSSTLRARAVRAEDTDLNAESGFPDLVRFVTGRVAGGAVARLAASAAADVVAVCRQIESQFEAERSVLADPAASAKIMEELTAVKRRVEELRGSAAKWSQTLNDGIGDLNSDVDHDLRGRIRRLTEEADDLIDEFDPADSWHEVEGWLEAAVAEEIVENYSLLRARADELSERVWRHFQEASGQVLDQLAVYNPADLVPRAEVEHKMDLEKMSVRKQAMTALKGSYMGILMFTMLGSMAGLTLGPIAVGIGLAMGLGSLRTEKKRQLTQRRSQAKNAVRRYCDEVHFRVGKDLRDTLRRIQRQLRDHYSARAEELNRSTAQSLQAASDAVNRTKAERDKRLADIDAELARLRELRRRAEAVAG